MQMVSRGNQAMYQVQKTVFGSRITMAGTFSEEEAHQFSAELAQLRAATPGPRCCILDIRTLVPPESKVVDLITEALGLASDSGLRRAAIIVNSPVIKGQAIQVAFRAKAVDACRYFDASKIENWEELSLDWVVNGVEPDVPATTSRVRITAD
jgi:hypothetical protein